MSDPRFSIIPAGAVLDRNLEPRDLQVLCLFGRHTDRKGWCRRSQVQMAKEIGCARSTVQASIDRLVIAGWLEKRAAGELHTPGVRDSAHEYRVVLDTRDDPQDVVAPLPTDRHPVPAQDRHPLPTHGSAPMLTTPSNEKTPQPPLAGGLGFADLMKVWPEEHHGRPDNAAGTFQRLGRAEQNDALRLAPTVLTALSRRQERIPALVSYIRNRRWVEFDGAPPLDEDGCFVITPDRPEWGEWLGHIRREHGQGGVDRIVALRRFLPKTRWPPKQTVAVPA